MKKVVSLVLQRKNFFIFSFLRITSMVLALFSNIFIVRKLTVEEFGTFSLVLLIVNLITTFGFSWSSSSILYLGSQEKEIYGGINKTFWSRNIIISFSLVVVTIGIIFFRNQINSYIGINVWFLLLLWLYVSVIENYLTQYFLAVKRQVLASVISITVKIIYLLLVIILPFDVIMLIIIFIVSHSIVIFFSLKINKNDIGSFEYNRLWFKKVLNFSFWQLFGFGGIYLINFGDTAVIKYFMTNYEVGIYNSVYQLFNALASFSYVISSFYASSVSSYFASNNVKKIKEFYYKERVLVTILSLVGHIILIVLSKPIVVLLFGQEYVSAVPIFIILIFGSMVRYLTVFYMLYYNTNGKHKIQQSINIFVAIANVILSIIFVNLFGIIGPAIATVLTFVLSFLFSVFYCEKRIRSFVRG